MSTPCSVSGWGVVTSCSETRRVSPSPYLFALNDMEVSEGHLMRGLSMKDRLYIIPIDGNSSLLPQCLAAVLIPWSVILWHASRVRVRMVVGRNARPINRYRIDYECRRYLEALSK